MTKEILSVLSNAILIKLMRTHKSSLSSLLFSPSLTASLGPITIKGQKRKNQSKMESRRGEEETQVTIEISRPVESIHQESFTCWNIYIKDKSKHFRLSFSLFIFFLNNLSSFHQFPFDSFFEHILNLNNLYFVYKINYKFVDAELMSALQIVINDLLKSFNNEEDQALPPHLLR